MNLDPTQNNPECRNVKSSCPHCGLSLEWEVYRCPNCQGPILKQSPDPGNPVAPSDKLDKKVTLLDGVSGCFSKLVNLAPLTMVMVSIYLLVQLPSSYNRLASVFAPQIGLASFSDLIVQDLFSALNNLLKVFLPVCVVVFILDIAIKKLWARFGKKSLDRFQIPKLAAILYLVILMGTGLSFVLPFLYLFPPYRMWVDHENSSSTPVASDSSRRLERYRRMVLADSHLSDPHVMEQLQGMTPLMSAVQKGDASSVWWQLLFWGNPNEKDLNERTTLSYAISSFGGTLGNAPVFNSFNSGVEDKNRDNKNKVDDKTKLDIVRMLIGKGADVNENTGLQNISPLGLAVQRDNAELVKILMDAGAKANDKENNPLFTAIQNGNLEIVKLLVNQQFDVNAMDNYQKTPLMVAVSSLKPSIVQYLLSKGADIHQRDVSSRTALGMLSASMSGYGNYGFQGNYWREKHSPYRQAGQGSEMSKSDKCLAIIDALLKAGASINETDNVGNTILSQAMRSGDQTLINALLSRGATFDAKSPAGLNAFVQGIYSKNIDLVKTLIAHGADVHAVDPAGKPVLFTALDASYELVDLFLKSGADPNAKWYNGNGYNGFNPLGYNHATDNHFFHFQRYSNYTPSFQTPLFYAVTRGNEEIVHLLLDRKANINQVDDQGISALMLATANRNSRMVQALIQAGANINLRNKLDGQTALDIAQARNDEEIVLILKYHSAKNG